MEMSRNIQRDGVCRSFDTSCAAMFRGISYLSSTKHQETCRRDVCILCTLARVGVAAAMVVCCD